VDDNALLREQMAKYLRRKGYEVVTVESVEKALKALERGFDVCITDYKMTGMNGLDLISAIESDFSRTKVMLMTGSSTIQLTTKALNRGAYEVFMKPFQMDRVIKALGQIEEGLSGNPTVA